MQTVVKTYLSFVPFSQVENWSVSSLLENNFGYSDKYPFAKIGDFLKRAKNRIDVQDEIEYKRVTVKINNKGVLLRDIEKGKNIGTKKQFLAKAGQFIVSNIDARNGAFGIIPNDLEGAIVTNDFPLFDIDMNVINPYFLVFVTTTKEFIKFAQSCSSGTTNRQRMDIEMFLNQKIPLPSIPEQEKLVNAYYQKIGQAEALENEANDLDREVEKYIYDSLGIESKMSKKIAKGLQIISFQDLDKWSLDDIFNNNTISSAKYPLRQLNSICSLITDGTHQTPTYTKQGVIFLSAKNVTKEIIDWDSIKYVSKEAHENYCRRVKPEINDILLAKNGTTGVAAIVDVKKDFSIYVSLALLKPKMELVIPMYLLFLINSNICRKQFFSRLIGIGVPNLHLGEIKEVEIPLPPLSKQREIVNHITALKERIKTQRLQAVALKQAAEKEFETALFG